MTLATEYLGKHCKDIVTGFEGICTSVVEWMFGCSLISLSFQKSKPEDRLSANGYVSTRIKILDDGVADQFAIPEYSEPKYYGKTCLDKLHRNLKGVCVGRIFILGAAEQYAIEIDPFDPDSESHLIWLDEGRIEVAENQENAVDPGSVRTDETGGIFRAEMYPNSRIML